MKNIEIIELFEDLLEQSPQIKRLNRLADKIDAFLNKNRDIVSPENNYYIVRNNIEDFEGCPCEGAVLYDFPSVAPIKLWVVKIDSFPKFVEQHGQVCISKAIDGFYAVDI